MKFPVILQARLGSTRLPGKILRDLCGKPMLWYVLDALSSAQCVGRVVVAVPEDSAELVAPVAAQFDAPIVVGSEEDVLGRFADALRLYPAEHFIRATADNPFVATEYIDRIVALHLAEQADLSHYLGIPLGTGVEVVRSSALFEAEKVAADPYSREHVTPYLYAHREKYTILEPELALSPELRLTVDTADDFVRARRIMQTIYEGKPLPLDEILALLKSKPELSG